MLYDDSCQVVRSLVAGEEDHLAGGVILAPTGLEWVKTPQHHGSPSTSSGMRAAHAAAPSAGGSMLA